MEWARGAGGRPGDPRVGAPHTHAAPRRTGVEPRLNRRRIAYPRTALKCRPTSALSVETDGSANDRRNHTARARAVPEGQGGRSPRFQSGAGGPTRTSIRAG